MACPVRAAGRVAFVQSVHEELAQSLARDPDAADVLDQLGAQEIGMAGDPRQ